MPVSSPSYFPPNSISDQIIGINAGKLATGARIFLAGKSAGNNSTVSDLIIIGDLAGSAGITDPNAQFSIIIGSGSAKAVTNFSAAGQLVPGELIVLGSNSMPLLIGGSASILVGSGILANATIVNPNVIGSNILMGHNILSGPTAIANVIGRNVVIGNNALVGAAGNFNPFENVIIGDAAGGAITGVNLGANVFIGQAVAFQAGNNVINNVVIGQGSAPNLAVGSSQNSILGATVTLSGGSNSTVVGSLNAVSASNNTLLGSNINAQTNVAGQANIYIGFNVGAGPVVEEPIGNTNILMVGIGNGQATAVEKMMIYGNIAAGNFVLGNSTRNVNRDMVGTNTLKIINGTSGGATAPIGGGYFYVLAGDLHFVDSANLDTTLSGNVNLPAPAAGATLTTAGNVVFNAPTAGDTLTVAPSVGTGALIATNAALTNNAGGQVATILNGPLAGNPTKWIPINDNGTIRNIPAW